MKKLCFLTWFTTFQKATQQGNKEYKIKLVTGDVLKDFKIFNQMRDERNMNFHSLLG